MKNVFENTKDLVGDISEKDLKYVDFYVQHGFGVFIPTVGYCEYAITKGHSHPSYSFILYFGDTIFKSNIKASENEYLVQSIYPEFPHEETKGEKFNRYIAIMISKDIYENEYLHYKKSIEKYDINTFKVNKSIINYIEKFISECENCITNRERLLKNIINIIVNELIRGQLEIVNNKTILLKGSQIEEAINYMHQNYDEKITVSTLASLCKMSKTSFINIFRKETLYSPIDYLINIRIDKSKKLLRSYTKTVTEIALECGFNSLAHFSTCFLKKTGVNPKEYLNRYK